MWKYIVWTEMATDKTEDENGRQRSPER